MFTTQNIGREHEMYNKDVDDRFTQVLVFQDNLVICQFFGMFAKINASNFVRLLNTRLSDATN